MADSHLLLLVNFATFGWLELIKPTHYMPYCMGLVEHILTRCIFRTNVVNPIYNPPFFQMPTRKGWSTKKTNPQLGLLSGYLRVAQKLVPVAGCEERPQEGPQGFPLVAHFLSFQ